MIGFRMRPFGILLILAAILTPLYWYAEWIIGRDGTAMFSQYIASVAIIAMAITQLLATRMRWLEFIFGGLDRIYVIHKWLGILAITSLLIHDTVDAELKGQETFLTDLGETLGELSLYGLLALVVITIVTFIPYNLWRWTHKLMGAFFVFGAIHYILLMKPLAPVLPIGIYMLVFCALGIICYIYTLLPFRGGKSFVVEDVRDLGSALSVTLKPEKRGISHRAGQFAFLKFSLPGFEEVHPFTISQAPKQDETLRFTIKRLGDYTGRIGQAIKVGTKAKVSGAFGHFKRRGKNPEIWIAGGIGITPFLAWLSELEKTDNPIHLFYCVREENDAIHLEELKSKTKLEGFHLHLVVSSKGQRLSGSMIASNVDFLIKNADVYYCGPESLRKAMLHGLKREGLSSRRFHYEEFEIRSGIGIRNIVAWLLARFRTG